MTQLSRKLRAPAAAEYLGLSTSTLAKMRLRGDGPIYAKAGQLTMVQVRNPNEPHQMMTLPGLIICRNSEIPRLLEDVAGRSRWRPGS